jgi:signal transduction histidine kinase
LVEVDEILDEVRDLLVDRLAPNNIVLVVDRAADVHALCADAVQLKQALYNIVDNSADAITGTCTGGVITVRVRGAEPDFIEFEICDTGPGFSPNSAQLGISPFLTTKPDGTGIGLSIARSVAEAHGGRLTIEEAWPGAVVKLRIPAGKLT